MSQSWGAALSAIRTYRLISCSAVTFNFCLFVCKVTESVVEGCNLLLGVVSTDRDNLGGQH